MPALKLFGRKWLAGSDDLVYPGLLEICYRVVWLSLMILILLKYYPYTWQCESGGIYIRAYILGMISLLSVIVVTLIVLVNQSARGAIMEVEKRRHVPLVLTVKLALILPEILLNVIGTLWTFCDIIECNHDEHYTKTVIRTLVIFDWILFALILFGMILIFDPVGSKRYYSETNDVSYNESLKHRKVMSVWKRRFNWAFYWVRSDEYAHEAFKQVAGLLTALFRSTDLVPTDVVAGCILLRVQQKRETREMRRIQMLLVECCATPDAPKYTADLNRVFAGSPKWMNLTNARHFLRLSMAAYGWPFVMYRYAATGLCRMWKYYRCCACLRGEQRQRHRRESNASETTRDGSLQITTTVADDNCCLCHFAGFRYMSRVTDENDILFASFRNHVYELPFVVVRDRNTNSIVLAIRGSISLRDIFTDLTAISEVFEADGLPENTMAHKGMAFGAEFILKRLNDTKILEKAFEMYPDHDLILTGHSLGAGVGALLALKLRPKYPNIKVYAFSTPAGLLSREAARITEKFIFTVGLGDDFVMRLGVDSVENLRTGIMQTLHATRLPKYRILLNACGYMFFGVPTKDLESTWKKEFASETCTTSPLLAPKTTNVLAVQSVTTIAEAAPTTKPHIKSNIKETCLFKKVGQCAQKRYSKSKLFTAGRILHIVHRKIKKQERNQSSSGTHSSSNSSGSGTSTTMAPPTYEMRWAVAEDFRDIKVMPRMLLDHLPENVFEAINTILKEQRDDFSSI